jgi:hypothetical protein
VTIRDGTKYEEVIGVRREWVYPWRFDLASAYYDIAVMELGKRPVLLRHHIWFVMFQRYICISYISVVCFCTYRKTKFYTSENLVFLYVQ